MDLNQVEQMAEIMKKHDLAELSVEDGSLKIALKRGPAGFPFPPPPPFPPVAAPAQPVGWLRSKLASFFSIPRSLTCAWREFLELRRDPIRATLAMFGGLILMIVVGYGLNMDVDNLAFAVLDHDQSVVSTDYALNIAGSRYFNEKPAIRDYGELDSRLLNGELALIVEIPAKFGQDVQDGRSPEVVYWVDGGDANRAETINGYIESLHEEWNQQYLMGQGQQGAKISVQNRYRYNPDVLSLPAMVPATIPLLLMMVPAILSALSIVREKELGSIINLYVSPLTRAEFMLGKQLPYVGFALVSATLMVIVAVTLFDVPVKGSLLTLYAALTIYCILSTGVGLIASSVTNSQIAVVFLTMVGTMLPATQMCGMIKPISPDDGITGLIGSYYPTTHMLLISRGVFNKALAFADLWHPFLIMLIEIPILLAIAIMLQRKQEA